MENLRAYAEDEAQAPSVQTPVTKGPHTSEGLSASSSTSSTSASVPSTRTLSGPVQEVSAPLQSSSVVSREKTVSLKDIPPPPPPDEPYELFLARVACQTVDPAGGTPRPAAAEPVPPPPPLTTVGLRLPTPFPRFEDTTWASIPQVQGPRIRMPLPASCYVPPPQPWTWSGRGPDVPPLQVRSRAPLLSSMGPVRFPGPSTLAGGPPTEGPLPHLLPPTSSSVSKNAASPPPRFRGFFPGATPPFVQKEATTSVTTAALQMNPQTDENVSPGPPPAVVQDWKAQIFEDMRLYWKQLQGDAPPQSTVGPAVPQGNMGPDALRQLSPSGDREASRAQHKSGSKRAGSISRRRSSSRERSSGDRARRRDHCSRTSQDSPLSRERGQHPYDSDIRLLRLRADSEDDRHIPSTHPRGSPEPEQSLVEDESLSAAKVQKLFADLAAPPALSHYADPIPDNTANKQLVPYVRQSTTSSSSVKTSEPLETHGLFKNYQSFHRLSGDNEKEARTAAYHDLTTLMLSQTDEPQLINVSSTRPKTEEPFPHSAVSSNEVKKKNEKMILQWPPQSSHTKVIDRTLGLYQHGPPPKAGTNEKWPPPTVKNPWDKSFIPKEFPTTHKIPSAMPKRWDLHSTSPLMLRPPLSTAVPEVPDAAISKSSSWLEAFAARAAHTATMSATSIVSVYNFQQKVLEFLRDSAAKNNIQNDISVIDDLFQRANSMALEAHIMAHDSGVTATELFTHLHMLRRRSVLEDPTVSLPQRDKGRLLVMEVGGQDLFGPNARQVHEWKRDTDEENVKLIARVFDERNQRDKSKKKPTSSESRTPRSLEHRSPLAGLSRQKPKGSYSQKPGQSFRRQPKPSPYKARSGNQSRPQTYTRDRPNVSSASNRNDSRDQGQRRQEKDPKGPSSNRPFNRKGRGGGSGQGRK